MDLNHVMNVSITKNIFHINENFINANLSESVKERFRKSLPAATLVLGILTSEYFGFHVIHLKLPAQLGHEHFATMVEYSVQSLQHRLWCQVQLLFKSSYE